MNFNWALFIDFGILSLFLLAATLLRACIPFLQKYRVPNAVLAGFLLLFFYNFAAPLLRLTTENLRNIVYHLLGLSFAAMSLRKTVKVQGKNEVFPVTIVILMQHILQAIIGLAITFLIINTFNPGLFPGFGLLFPLGFALGPGQAMAFSSKWSQLGFAGAESVGVTFAAMGFLMACFGGMILINIGIRKNLIQPPPATAMAGRDDGLLKADETKAGMKLISQNEAIDTLSLNAGLVFVVYFLTFLMLSAVFKLLSGAGHMARQFGESLWAITFVFSGLTAQLVKQVLIATKADRIIDNGAMSRISGFSVDYLVAASLGLISLMVVKEYWLEMAIITVVGTVALIFLQILVSQKVFSTYAFYRMITIYGAMTGTIATGLMLLRVVDPEFKTPVASQHMWAAGLTFPLAIPFIMMADFPAYYFTTGKALWLVLTVVVLLAYCVFIALSITLIYNKRKNRLFS